MTKHNGKNIGYVRVSSIDQNTARQLDNIELDKIFTDKASGKDTARPGLQATLEYLRDGDCLHVHSMDRLARNLADLLSLVKDLTGRGVAVRFHKESLTFTSEHNPMQDLQLAVMGAVAQFEREMIKERQREGLAAAKAAGRHCGRPSKLTPEEQEEIRNRAAAGENKSALASEFGISRAALYNQIR